MAALRSLVDDDFDAGYDRLEARAHVDYDGTTDYDWALDEGADGTVNALCGPASQANAPSSSAPVAVGALLLHHVDRVIASLDENDVATPNARRNFWKHVERGADEACWEWAGSRDKDGYGRFGWQQDGRVIGRVAHRFSYELLVGPIPDGLTLDHLCRCRACVNPAHLEPVTRRENILRGDGFAARAARKTHCPQGHPYDEENTYRDRRGRYCRTCKRSHAAKWNAKRKASGSTVPVRAGAAGDLIVRPATHSPRAGQAGDLIVLPASSDGTERSAA